MMIAMTETATAMDVGTGEEVRTTGVAARAIDAEVRMIDEAAMTIDAEAKMNDVPTTQACRRALVQTAARTHPLAPRL